MREAGDAAGAREVRSVSASLRRVREMKRAVPAYEPVIYIAGSYFARWVLDQWRYRAAVRASDDEAREEGRLLYAAPEAMK